MPFHVLSVNFRPLPVVLGLVEAQAAGYTIDPYALTRAVQYLELHLNHNITFNNPDWQLNQQAFLLYVLARSHEDPAMLLADMDRLYQERVQMSLAGRAYLLLAPYPQIRSCVAIQGIENSRRHRYLLSNR